MNDKRVTVLRLPAEKPRVPIGAAIEFSSLRHVVALSHTEANMYTIMLGPYRDFIPDNAVGRALLDQAIARIRWP